MQALRSTDHLTEEDPQEGSRFRAVTPGDTGLFQRFLVNALIFQVGRGDGATYVALSKGASRAQVAF